MPGIPLVARETTCSRSADQMCRHESRARLSAEEEIAAEESFSIYCKPVELYNILQHRAIRNPLFLQRCLQYKLEAKQKRRMQITVSLRGTIKDDLFPMYVMLARPVSTAMAEHSVVYRFRRTCVVTRSTSFVGTSRTEARFVLPEIKRLSAEIQSGSLTILLVSCANFTSSFGEKLTEDHMDMSSLPSKFCGYCLLGEIPMKSIFLSQEKPPNITYASPVCMHSCLMKLSCSDDAKYVLFQFPFNNEPTLPKSTSEQVPVIICGEEYGEEDTPYSSHVLRTGNVVFNYKYYDNKLQKTEVTEDFTCPFCLVKCASFKGLRDHLPASHDLFNFDFWVTEEYQAVNISVKTDMLRFEIVAGGVDPKQQPFFFCSKPLRRRRRKSPVQNAKHARPLVLNSDMPQTINEHMDKAKCVPECVDRDTCSPNATGVSSATAQSIADPECVQSIPGSNLAPPATLQFAKTRKLSFERAEPRNRALLKKRQFFHSQRAQPMATEQVLSDRDSEDEVDDDVADFEDRRMLDDFVDVTEDEKQVMHLWNSFVRKQRVLADGHIPWACEAFSKLHGPNLVQAPALLWCWRLFMIKLWNHGLLDARCMNNCNVILEQCPTKEMDPSEAK